MQYVNQARSKAEAKQKKETLYFYFIFKVSFLFSSLSASNVMFTLKLRVNIKLP